MLRDRRRPTDAERASALTDYGPVMFRHFPGYFCLRESGEIAGQINVTANLDAFVLAERDGWPRVVGRGLPLEVGVRFYTLLPHHGRRYGREAAAVFVHYAFNMLKASRVVAEAKRSEPNAVMLMEFLRMSIRPAPLPDYPKRAVGVREAEVLESGGF